MRIAVVGTGRIGVLHAQHLVDLGADVVVADADVAAAARVADELGVRSVATFTELLESAPDGLVVATSTTAHAEQLRAGMARGIPTFCEKPVAAALAEAVDLARLERETGARVHIGFQRRLDAGFRRAARAVADGELGRIHLVRAVTHDQAPPPPGYLPLSGGIFRDCNIHDFDAVRFVTGREASRVFAVGANKGESFFTENDDVDTAAALLTMDDGTIAVVSSTRYNGAGHDVRMEIAGTAGALAVGLDDSIALTSAEPGATFPAGPPCRSFVERFRAAYQAEMAAFLDMVRGAPSPCTVFDGLQAMRLAEACDRSRRLGRPIDLAEVPDDLARQDTT